MSDKPTAADFVQDIEAAQKKVEALNQSNRAKTESLAKEGFQVSPGLLALWKIDALINTILTTKDAKTIYEYNFEVTRRKFLDDMLSELRQMQLLEGVQEAKTKFKIPGR